MLSINGSEIRSPFNAEGRSNWVLVLTREEGVPGQIIINLSGGSVRMADQ